MTSPKVLVGCPVSDYHQYCTEEYLAGLKALTYDNFDILLIDNSKTASFSEFLKQKGIPHERAHHEEPDPKKRVVACRNILRKHVLDKSYDYLLSLEQDVVPPPNVIEQLLARKTKIVSGVYFNHEVIQGKQVLLPVLYRSLTMEERNELRLHKDKLQTTNPELYKQLQEKSTSMEELNKRLTEQEVRGTGVIPVSVCGLGCVLIHKDVLEKIEFRLDENMQGYDDVPFSKDAQEHSFYIYADLAVKCKHYLTGRTWTWSELTIQNTK